MFSWLTKQSIDSIIKEGDSLLGEIKIDQERPLEEIDILFDTLRKVLFVFKGAKKSDTTDAQREKIEKLEKKLMSIAEKFTSVREETFKRSNELLNNLRRGHGNN